MLLISGTRFEASLESLVIEDFLIELKKIPFWAKWYYSLNRKKIDQQIQKSINDAILQQIDQVKSEIQALLASYEIVDGLFLKVELEKLVPIKAQPKKDRLIIDVEIAGKMELLIEKIALEERVDS